MSSFKDNYSLFTVPAAWFVAFVPHVVSTLVYTANKTSPRAYQSILEKDQRVDQATKDRFTRLRGAQQNGFENLGFFAAAVVAGNLAGLPSQTLNGLSAGYVLSRVLYTAFYVSNTNPKISDIRSALWLVGIAQCITLFVKAGNALSGGA